MRWRRTSRRKWGNTMNRQLEIDEKMYRLANYLECWAADIIPELLSNSWPFITREITCDVTDLIASLRQRAEQIEAHRIKSDSAV